jgi:hypothetical protein
MTSQERVNRAAEWLDRNHPDWANKVDLTNFDMGDSEACVGFYVTGDDEGWCRLNSQFVAETDLDGAFSCYTDEWEVAIEARQTAIPVVNREPLSFSDYKAKLAQFEQLAAELGIALN